MHNWVYEAGYPLLNVTVDEAGGVFVSQVCSMVQAVMIRNTCSDLPC